MDWIEFPFDIEEPLYYHDIEYVQGVVYCSLPCAMIGVFDVALKLWKIDAKSWLIYHKLGRFRRGRCILFTVLIHWGWRGLKSKAILLNNKSLFSGVIPHFVFRWKMKIMQGNSGIQYIISSYCTANTDGLAVVKLIYFVMKQLKISFTSTSRNSYHSTVKINLLWTFENYICNVMYFMVT